MKHGIEYLSPWIDECFVFFSHESKENETFGEGLIFQNNAVLTQYEIPFKICLNEQGSHPICNFHHF